MSCHANCGKLEPHMHRSDLWYLLMAGIAYLHCTVGAAACICLTSGTCSRQALHICIALLERRQPSQASGRADAVRQSMERSAAATAELDSKLEADTVEGICQHSGRLAALLDTSPQLTQLVSPACM